MDNSIKMNLLIIEQMLRKVSLFILLVNLIALGQLSESKTSLQDSLGASKNVKLFLCGDVMTGRGIDQILPVPSNPVLYEKYVKNAERYVEIAEAVNGKIPYPVSYDYIWGDAIHELNHHAPDLRIINLETSITTSSDYWESKGINYRMNPANIKVLTSANIDVCALANNHLLDWGYKGLEETIKTLKSVSIKGVGAGRTIGEARKPSIINIKNSSRVILFSYGGPVCGIPPSWKARETQGGINRLEDFSIKSIGLIKKEIDKIAKKGDVMIISIHWGGNWGYGIEPTHQRFARQLIDIAGVDIIHGHSSHHVKGIEVYKEKLVLYGCGDFINDYEGIGGHKKFRPDLTLMYFPVINPSTGNLVSLNLVPMQIKNFKLNRVSKSDSSWLREVLNREGIKFGTSVEQDKKGDLILRW